MANTIDEVGGAQRVVHEVAQGLALRGYPVDVVGIAPYSPVHEFISDPAYRRFVLMSDAWPPPPAADADPLQAQARRADRDRLAAEAVVSLEEVLADGPVGVVVTAQLWAMEFLAQVPHEQWAVIGQYHSSFEAAAGGRDLARAVTLYADVDVFTLLTPADAEQFRRQGLNNTTWLPNPLAFWPPDPVSPLVPGLVTYLGRVSAEKGVSVLVEAWGRIAARHPDWRLRLVGSGPDEKAIRAAVAALPEGADRVEMVPPVLDAEAELATAGVVVLPSLTEGLPLVLMEAMALGLPCLATDCSAGVRMLSHDGRAARLTARGDAGALASDLSALLDDGAEREVLGQRARAAMAAYRADSVLDRWEQLLVDVLR